MKPESISELDKVVLLLTDNPKLTIRINGYTDNIGTAADNLTLSISRAKSVINYFISKGINASRLSSKGFGASQPIALNTAEEGRAQNRRTELKITAN